jgi:hypothetical protein
LACEDGVFVSFCYRAGWVIGVIVVGVLIVIGTIAGIIACCYCCFRSRPSAPGHVIVNQPPAGAMVMTQQAPGEFQYWFDIT